jgi:hypothetical protein
MSESKTYGLDVKPFIESKARLLRFFKTKDFFAGRKFEVSFQFENTGSETIPALIFASRIEWPSGQHVTTGVEVPALESKKKWTSKPEETDALCEGFGLLYMRPLLIVGSAFIPVSVNGERLDSKVGEVCVATINARRAQEVYALWGLVVSAFGLLVVALDKIVTFVRWLFPN